jgi:hypothetical protein
MRESEIRIIIWQCPHLLKNYLNFGSLLVRLKSDGKRDVESTSYLKGVKTK